MNPTQGFCVHALSAKEFFVDDARPFGGLNWQKLKASSVIVPPSSWAELKAYILKRCVSQGDCDELEEPMPGEEAIRKLDKRRK